MIRIEYQIPTANGNLRNKVVIVSSAKEAEEICKTTDEVGYKLVDVSNIGDDYYFEDMCF